ncbi:sigma 54-interacting transcriptional regulator [Sorangium sp. So ce204]|uniref:sigma 54-interacting transcriptional regulator n=1 Tax=Sorangium sp. So ce204 TaxID=3133288 RepID=UPI003F61E442
MRLLTLPTPESTTAPTERAKALLFEDPRSQELLHRARQVAAGDAAAVITGEIGTGKEIIARHVHELSARRGRPFLAVSCAALSPALAESELFGHEQGASPKALTMKHGLLEAAEGGTLERVEEIVIRTAYRRCDRNLGLTAARLGVSRDLVRARLLQSGEIAQPSTPEPPAAPSRPGDARAAAAALPISPP